MSVNKAYLFSWSKGGLVNGTLLMLAIVGDKPGWRAAWPAEAGPLAQGPCCVLHPGESGVAGVTLISVVLHY